MTLRGLLIGLALVVVIAATIPYTDLLVKGSWFGLTAFPIASLLAMVAATGVLAPLMRALRRPLQPRELALISSMALVSAGIPSFGLTGLLLPYLVGPVYFFERESHFLEYLPRWGMVWDEPAYSGFYESLQAGEPIPWHSWATPLFCWCLLVVAVYMVFFGLVALFRKPWMEGERLVFPLAELPAALVSPETVVAAGGPPFLRNRLMWAFAIVPLVIHTVNGIGFYYPSWPRFNINLIPIDALFFTEHPWNKLGVFWLRVPFCIIGIAYLLPLAVSRSLWVFYFLFLVQTLIGAQAGYLMPPVQAYPVKAFIGQQMWGGIIAGGVCLLWTARGHLRDALRRARHGRGTGSDDEMLSPRAALLCVVTGFVGVCAFGTAAGAGLWSTALVFGLYFLTHLVAVRLVCEGGMLYVQHPFRPFNFLLTLLGSAGLPKSRIPMLALLDHLWMLDNRSPLMPTLMLSQRIAESSGLRRRSLTPALALAVLVSAGVAFYTFLRIVYENGGLVVEQWFSVYYARNLYGTWTEDLMTIGQAKDMRALGTMVAGAATFLTTLKLYHAYPKTALHPIGYLMGASWPMVNFWFPIMLAWAIKSVIMRIGGAQLYRRLVPGFLGLVLSEFLCAAFWAIVGAVTRTEGYKVFQI